MKGETQYRAVGNATEVTRLTQAPSLRALRPILAANQSGFGFEGFDLAVNATLRKDEWEQVDEQVNEVMRERLTFVDDMRAAGLIQPVGLGTILRVTERLEARAAAEISYDGSVAHTRDRPSFLQETVPVPIVAAGFQIGWRQLEASRMRGEPLDLTAAADATRAVRDKMQDLVVNGFGHGPSATTIQGLENATNRLIYSLPIDWDDSGAGIIADVEAALATAYNSNLFGPFTLYVPKNYWAVLQGDYSSAKGDRTYMERILAFEDIQAIRPLDSLTADNAMLVSMTKNVIDWSEAQAITTVQWEKDPFTTEFRVLQVGGPHIKSIETDDGSTINGIVHLAS